MATPKFGAQSLKKVGELKWKPIQFFSNVIVSVSAVLKPAGLENAQGLLSAAYLKDPNDPQWKNDAAMNEWRAFMTKWYPEGDQADAATVYGYGVAVALVNVLKQCGDNMTRENLMKQTANLHNLKLPMLLPGITLNTSADDFDPIKQMQLEKFDGTTWKVFGEVLSGSGS